jgi:hypothetical protein
MCGSGLLELSSKLSVPTGQQSWQAWIIWCPQCSRGPGIYLCWGIGSRSQSSCGRHRGSKPVGSGSSGAYLSGASIQEPHCQHGKPSLLSSGSCSLLEPWVLLIQGHWLPWHFKVKVAGHVVGRTMEPWVPVFAGKQDLPLSENWVMESGAMWRFQGQGIGSVELQVILPILPMVSCFTICGFRESFVSYWLWDPMGAFWSPLIFLLQGR